ncbi:STAS domain-containing protein [Fictibacillus barbaricus]|uniref:RsbT co-antagonist protein RsbR n=1 Tax=Fictibacillus barbaricus TaxID=182136 RepID=A0ABU1TV26_9BACL|nr:STAS domain-containing protein [Fictibacillus barbaricus]MDR7071063.1 rsbT co-antagonist protein RsbR [Fictibacillus barbaricus]
MKSTLTVASYLKENSVSLANEIVDEIIIKFGFEVSQEDIDQAKIVYVEFFEFLSESINCTEGSVPEELIAWSRKNGEKTASKHSRISDILIRYPETRMVFADFILDISLKFGLDTEGVVLILKRVHQMLDVSINETVLAFERRSEEILSKTRKELKELSTPIVPIQDGLAVLPLIGSIDAERAEHLMNYVLPNIPSLNIECLIMDFSGIVTIDTEVAAHVFNVYEVLGLLGIKVLVTGIRSELAIRAVSEGINFSSLKTFANVKQAIESIRSYS